ncbi:MAG TPA: ornithine cyclodeaminase family protein [Terriglobales bacterium]|jgi:ornithine cyclodeaminase/alanine dehydrogenase-like protein (mu-crystallin family)|nr:ornithine cyclodeaminase family protein [Terriglobales bacterium]
MVELSEDDVRRRLDPRRVIAAIEAGFRDRYPHVVVPVRTQVNTAEGVFLIMPCYDRTERTLGMKLVVVQNNPARPEDRVQATYMLLDPETGSPRLLLSAKYLTDLRTAATSGVATRLLAREDARVLGVFGTGRQARAHLKVLPLVRHLEQVLVCGKDFGEAREFTREVSAELGLAISAADARTCAAESDVICTCTTSQVPLFDGALLRPGTHLNLVGAFQAQAREVDSTTVKRARVVVDTYEGALAEAGDLLIPMGEGRIGRDHIACELHELLSGKKPGRVNTEEITLFKSLGCALEDLVAAEMLVADCVSPSGSGPSARGRN